MYLEVQIRQTESQTLPPTDSNQTSLKGVCPMETIELVVGSVNSTSHGMTQDHTRPVEFEGEKLAEYRELGIGRSYLDIARAGCVVSLGTGIYRCRD